MKVQTKVILVSGLASSVRRFHVSLRLESTRNDEELSVNNDPAAVTADDQDIETLDETKIDDLDKRLTLVARKYALIKRRIIDKQCRTRALHLGQDRYRRRYWYFSHLPGIYIEGLSSGDISADEILSTVDYATKQKFDQKPATVPPECNTLSRSAQRKKQQVKVITVTPPASIPPVEPSTPVESTKVTLEQSETEELLEQQQLETAASNSVTEDLATMDLSAFCMAAKRDQEDINPEPMIPEVKTTTNGYEMTSVECCTDRSGFCFSRNGHDVEMKVEPSDDVDIKTEDENLPLDLSCAKPTKSSSDGHRSSSHAQAAYPLLSMGDQFQELNDLATAAMLLNNIKQEPGSSSKNLLDFTHSNLQSILSNPMMASYNFASSLTHEATMANFKHIEQSIREKFQYAEPLPIPEGNRKDELKTLV